MIYKEESALQVARHLLAVKAIQLSPEKPFIWASGLHAPIYCDNRIALSFPLVRNFIKKQLCMAANEFFSETQAIVGVATAGIPQGALMAEEMNLPFAYVRSKKKDHGMTNQIEGHLEARQKVLVVEDLVSTGKSSLLALSALKEAQIEVLGMVSIFTYSLDVAQKNFEAASCQLVSISDYDHLITVAAEQKYITNNDLKSLSLWRQNPELWSQNHQH